MRIIEHSSTYLLLPPPCREIYKFKAQAVKQILQLSICRMSQVRGGRTRSHAPAIAAESAVLSLYEGPGTPLLQLNLNSLGH